MGRSARRRAVVGVGVLALSIVGASPARAQRKERCIADFEEGQDLREKLKLVAAREKLMACAQDACPTLLRKDCLHAVEELTRDLPTVTFGARDASGQDLSAIRIVVDDKPLVLDESGRSVPLDPGPHFIRFERDGFAPLRREVLVRMGERNREIVATLERLEKEGASSAPSPALAPSTDARSLSSRTTWAWMIGGVGVVGLGGFGYFGVTGKDEKVRLQHLCAPACTDAQVGGLKSRYIAADVSLGVGVVALAVAAYLLLVPESPRSAAPSQRFARSIWK